MSADKYRCPQHLKLVELVAVEEYGAFNSYLCYCPDCSYNVELDADELDEVQSLRDDGDK